MRTQIAKTEYLPAEYIPPTFLTRTPSPYSAGSSWGLLSRKIFFDFYLSDFARIYRMFGLRIIFLFFFVTSFLFGFVLDFIRNICRFNSLQVFFRYSSRLYSLDIYSFAILVFASEFLLASISTCFSIVYSML